MEQNLKSCRSSDCSLKLENMKLESLVIADQNAAVNKSIEIVHTARQVREVSLIRNLNFGLLSIYFLSLF